MRHTAILALAPNLAAAGWAAPAAADNAAQDVAYGAASVLGTAVYAPFKATFSILGASRAASSSPSRTRAPRARSRPPGVAARGPSRRAS